MTALRMAVVVCVGLACRGQRLGALFSPADVT